MAGGFQDAALRAQLHTDVASAWAGLTKIYDDDPAGVDGAATLPYAHIELVPPVVQQYSSGVLKDVLQRYVYDIHGAFGRPTSGTVTADIQTKVNALTAVLMASGNQSYASVGGAERLVTEADWDDGISDGESRYTLRIRFEVACFGNYA